ncbi:MAG: hypothetical protein HWD61_06960 [Parachlamydiaceae bacterium]|nr:MAG: hypothetical protein HWD61_06960 [Parachlamydiaceae bacterium]
MACRLLSPNFFLGRKKRPFYDWLNLQFPNTDSSWYGVIEELKDKITPEVVQIFEKHLSKETLQLFIHHCFGLISACERGSTNEGFKDTFYAHLLDLADAFSMENREFVLEALCYSDDTSNLLRLLEKHPHENLMKKCLT